MDKSKWTVPKMYKNRAWASHQDCSYAIKDGAWYALVSQDGKPDDYIKVQVADPKLGQKHEFKFPPAIRA